MTENEKNFVRSIVDYDANILSAQKYIKENYNVDSTFDDDNMTLKLSGDAVNIIEATEYIFNEIDESLVNVIY